MIRNFIFSRAEKQYIKYKNKGWKKFKIKNKELISLYKDKEAEIDQLVKNVRYWHGTGRFQYKKQGESKYEGVSKNETLDLLQKIISDGGLKPHYDPWGGKYIKTPYSISLANQWGYGKMYAYYHSFEDDKLQYEIAPIDFWYKLIMRIQLTENYFKFALGFFIWYALSDSLKKQGKVWLSTFRSDTDKKWPFWKILTAQSDINDNYSVLFAIKGEVNVVEIPKIMRFLETRTDEHIEFNQISFVAVPLSKVEVTKRLFSKNSLTIKIIPLELIEIYMRRYSIKQIMTQSYV